MQRRQMRATHHKAAALAAQYAAGDGLLCGAATACFALIAAVLLPCGCCSAAALLAEAVLSPTMRAFQGPALLSFNDSMLSAHCCWLAAVWLLPCCCTAADAVLSPAMRAFQGPALLAFNDGVFSEKDFESISRIGDSKKREQLGKTGRFG